MDKPSIDVVLKALAALYSGTDPRETEEASKWLMQLQRSVCPNSAHPLCSSAPLMHLLKFCPLTHIWANEGYNKGKFRPQV